MRDDAPKSGGGLSRRAVLYAAAATGAAATTGSGVSAFLTDAEQLQSRLTAGTLDLAVDVRSPSSWREGAYTGSLSLYEPQTAEFELTVDTNPAYVWLVAPCPACEPVEAEVGVELELTIPGVGSETLFDGTLAAFREAYGAGGLLSTRSLAPGTETWLVSFTWTLLEPVADGVDVAFGFEFHAVQERHLGDPRSFDLGLAPCGDCEDDHECGKDISYVAFCASAPIDLDDVSFERVECGDSGRKATLTVTGLPSSVGHVLLKAGTKLDVFAYDGESTPFSVTTGGDGSDLRLVGTYAKRGDEYPGSGTPPRRNSDPCPGEHWVKHEFDSKEGDKR